MTQSILHPILNTSSDSLPSKARRFIISDLIVIVGLLVLAWLIFVLLKERFSYSLSISEVAVLPILLIAISKISLFGCRIPKILLYISLSIAAISVSWVEYGARLSKGDFYISRLSDDLREIDSRTLREGINHYLAQALDHGGALKLRALRHSKIFKDQSEINHFVAQDKVLVWGDTEWLHVSFPQQKAMEIGELYKELPDSSSRLRLVMSVSSMSISYRPANDTAWFLAMLLAATSQPPYQLSLELRKQFLTDAHTFLAFWVGYKHRAFAAWQLGNLEFLDFLAAPDQATLNCAISAYKRATQLVASTEHPELYSAILNNLAVAEHIAQQLYFVPTKSGRIKDLLTRAAGLARLVEPKERKSGPWKVAQYNLHR